jgi:hypothetical protein
MYAREVIILPEKTIAIRIDESLHRKIKFRLADLNMSLKDYILGLIKKDLNDTDLEMKVVTDNGTPLKDELPDEVFDELEKSLKFINEVVSGKYVRK